jgi:hypothetical protein
MNWLLLLVSLSIQQKQAVVWSACAMTAHKRKLLTNVERRNMQMRAFTLRR